jgi:hypothetical protein
MEKNNAVIFYYTTAVVIKPLFVLKITFVAGMKQFLKDANAYHIPYSKIRVVVRC